MDTLIQDTLVLLREMAKTTPTVFATAEECAYFASKTSFTTPSSEKKPIHLPIHLKGPSAPSRPPVQPEVKDPPPKKIEKIGSSIDPGMHLWVEKVLPDLPLRKTIPDDTAAQKRSRLWEETYLTSPVVIIAFGEIGPGLEFLRQLTQAINHLLMPAQLIEGSLFEKEQGWNLLLSSKALKQVISSPWSSWKTTSLTAHYHQNGSTMQSYLGNHPLLFLESSLFYLKDPERKRKLWNTLNMQLSSLT